MPEISALLRSIPSVDRLLQHESFAPLLKRYSQALIKEKLQHCLDSIRSKIRSENVVLSPSDVSPESIAAATEGLLKKSYGPKLKNVINATGVIVHTNLGRSPLSKRVVERIAQAASEYSNLEYNLDEGRRGERNAHLRELIKQLTGAESAIAVNNNAAAVLLALSSLAFGKEVIVSRGELIEIGGSFRIPDVMSRSGAILREVGTTNRTHPKDYVQAINEKTALILKVHTSNYRITGFTKEVSLEELAEIGASHGLPTMMDLGSGCLIDLSAYGLSEEITVQDVVAKGIDVISFSGDKLLGGPQAGILCGKAELIEKMRTNALARALRMDKLTLAGLEATLIEYTRPEGPTTSIPTLNMITRSVERLESDAVALLEELREAMGKDAEIGVEPGIARVGGGALPMSDLPGPRVSVKIRNMSAAALERRLRLGEPPLIVLVKDDRVLLDPRTLLPGQIGEVTQLIKVASLPK